MKAAVISEYNKIEIKVVELPKLKDDHILVKIKYAAINPFDIKLFQGKTGIKIANPIIPGGDFSGVIESNPNNLGNFKKGQKVYGSANAVNGQGAFAEFAPININQIALVKEGVDLKLASALPLVGASAFQAIYENIQLKPNQSILILGGAGGIGSIAVQLAKIIGSKVITTVKSNDIDYAKQLGADEVINVETDDFVNFVKNIDAVLDTVGGEDNIKAYKILKSGGVLNSMTTNEDKELIGKYKIRYVYQQTKPTSDKLSKIMELLSQNKLSIRIDREVELDNISLAYAPPVHSQGKTLIKISD